MNRRFFLVLGVAVTGLFLASILPFGCGRTPPKRALKLFIWSEYILPEVKTRFEQEFGVQVIEDNYASNEEMMAKLQAGAIGYDLIVPTDYTVSLLVKHKLLLEIDRSRITHFKNLSKQFLGKPHDKENRYSVPYMWGISGLGYNRNFVKSPPTSWADVFDLPKLKQLKNRISMLDDMRELTSAALIYLGYSPNTTNTEELKKAKELLLKQKEYLAKYDSESYGESLASGETAIAHSWSGEIVTLQVEKPELEFAIPKEGVLCFLDNWCIPKGAPNKALAEDFIDFTLRPEISAILVNYLGYVSPNEAVKPLLDPRVLKTPAYNIPEGVKLWYLEDLGEGMKLYEDLWTELKAD